MTLLKTTAKVAALTTVLVAVTGLFCPAGAADPVEVVWEMDYTRLHFDWYGTWDEVAWWAYALWYLDLPDWCYLWAWYGLGWDQLSPRTTPPTGKINVWLVWTPFQSEFNETNVWFSIHTPLTLTSDQWFYQTLEAGQRLTYELCRSIYVDEAWVWTIYACRFTGEALATYTRDFIYPWYSYSGGQWHCAMDFATLSSYYKSAVAGNGNAILSWTEAGYGLSELGYAHWDYYLYTNSYYTIEAAGYYMYNYTGHQDVGYIATLVHQLTQTSFEDAYFQAFGRTLNAFEARISDPNDFYYYFYHYYWG